MHPQMIGLRILPLDECNDPSFYCSMINDKMCLDGLHPYYHQVQLELYVCAEKAVFCDFCIFPIKGVFVERIYPDDHGRRIEAKMLDDYFMEHILPELVTFFLLPTFRSDQVFCSSLLFVRTWLCQFILQFFWGNKTICFMSNTI